MDQSRRDFLLLAPGVALPMLPMLLSEAKTVPELRNEAVWTEGSGDWFLRVGWHAPASPSPVFGVLTQGLARPTCWTFRFAHREEGFEAETAAGARKHAERLLVEWWRACLVELERLVFVLN